MALADGTVMLASMAHTATAPIIDLHGPFISFSPFGYIPSVCRTPPYTQHAIMLPVKHLSAIQRIESVAINVIRMFFIFPTPSRDGTFAVLAFPTNQPHVVVLLVFRTRIREPRSTPRPPPLLSDLSRMPVLPRLQDMPLQTRYGTVEAACKILQAHSADGTVLVEMLSVQRGMSTRIREFERRVVPCTDSP